jgi:subtilase family serine protease
MASDLANFNTQMGLPHMCGEPGAACGAAIPTFQHVYWNGKTQVKSPPPGSNGTGLQNRDAWTLETALDVEWAHAMAPLANILNVTTNPAETQGVQGFPTMMNAEQFIVDNHQATVITQSFGAVEEGFGSTQSLLNLRHAFISAAANGVTVLASSGDGGTANSQKTPVKNPTTLPYPTVNWPASDPLVTGGTSCSSPQFAGLVAIADQIAGHGLGQINPTLYKLASGPDYSTYFYDVTTGNNQTDPSIPGYPATTGWDPITGLGTPNAANLVPALAAG